MTDDIAAFWDERYRTQEAVPERGPASFLVESLHLLPPGGAVLDIATGSGRNALFLAARGYEVTGIDISPVAIERCREEAARLGRQVRAICADLASYRLPGSAFDVVLNFYYLQRELCPRIETMLRPGGLLVFETFTTEQRRHGWGPTQDEHLLRPGELPSLFPGLEQIVYREGIAESERGKKHVAGLVARRPRSG